MRFKKFISCGISLSLILSSILMNLSYSFANSTLDDRYEHFEGDAFSIDNILEGVDSGFEIEGHTMVNVFDYSKMPSLTSTPNSLGFYMNGKTITRNYTMALGNPTNTSLDSTEDIIKNGETYTYVLDITDNTMDNGVEIFPHIGSFAEWFKGNVKIDQGYRGKVILSFKAKADYKVKLLYRHFDHTKSGSISISNIMLLKGDYYDTFTSKSISIPKYFEGSQSVGEKEGKSELVSENENLFNINNLQAMHYSYDLPIKHSQSNSIFSVNGDTISYSISSSWNIGVGGVYKVKNNTSYTIKYEKATCSQNFNMSINVLGLKESELDDKYWYSDSYYKYNSRLRYAKKAPTEQNVSVTYNTGNYDYLVVYVGGNWTSNPTGVRTITLTNVGIYETGDSSVEYERYNSNKVEVELQEPLRGIPNGAKDKIIKKNGKWYIERNVGYAVIDGSESWYQVTSNNGIKFFEENMGLKGKHYHKASSQVLLSDKLLNKKIYLAMTSGEYLDYTMTTDLYDTNLWRIATTQNMTVSEFKSWLSVNNPEIYYELETPVYEPIDDNLSIYLYEGISYISLNSNIPGNVKMTVDRILNKVVESVNAFKENPTMQNLSIARMWINAMDESNKKDYFQNEVNGIGVTDLTVPPKIVTSNMDIYIKSENTLSMSLNTNYVTFENYSGIEEMEKLNAVNITVNSSLPYDLNAYLPQDISNSDGSKIIDIDVLNIRESGNSTYQRFNGLNNKLVLNDNCAEGNNKVHAIDLKLASDKAHKADVYKTVIKFEIAQK